jgi:nitrous oxidase accessory protein
MRRSGPPASLFALLAFLLVLGPVLAAQSPDATPTGSIITVQSPEIPDDALVVCDGCAYGTIDEALADASDGETIHVRGGTHDAEVVIDKPVRVIGTEDPVIDAHGEGTAVRISSPDVLLQGFTIQNTGRSFDREHSGVYVEGERVQVVGNRIINALFGVNAATSHDMVIAGNYIEGQTSVESGLRGDGIKVWYSHRTEIYDNHVNESRDLLVWYSNEVRVYNNVVENGRYGFHFMNSDDGFANSNTLIDNSVGIYIMYGKRFAVRDNLLQGSRGPSGHGLGLKEVDGAHITGNVIYDNRVGVYIDNSPLSPNEYDYFQDNLFAYNDSAIGILPSARNNHFTRNSFVENLEHVTVLGSGPISGGNLWTVNGVGNFWSDYSGYDADGDGVGDVAYRSEQLSERLMQSHPDLQLFRYSLAASAVDFGAEAVPLFRSEPILVDNGPLVRPILPSNAPEAIETSNERVAQAWSIGMIGLVSAILLWGIFGGQLSRDDRHAQPDRHASPEPLAARKQA